jgi:group II intron reverse transcriptase/maturase
MRAKLLAALQNISNKVDYVMIHQPTIDRNEWKTLPWKKFRKIVFKLQCRIWKAQKAKDYKKVKRLQRLLLSSKAAKYLAVRQITQLNSGKKTAGIDKKTALTPKERLSLVKELIRNWSDWKHSKLRRVWIPKRDGTRRGLGIPTIGDRAYQSLLKYALEPLAEAYFSANSYGFRPGRSTWDVQKRLFNYLKSDKNGLNKRILELDIEKCFDRINHEKLTSMVELPQKAKLGLYRAIKAGVKAEYPTSEMGTPQGGCISPLLANIALHGLEDLGNGIRYADDCVFILKPNEDATKLRQEIDSFLHERGLKVKEAKTKLVLSTDGFDFLGWKFIVRKDGRFLSTPNDENYKKVKEKVKAVLTDSRFKLSDRIKKVGSIVRGWRRYHQYCDMSRHDLYHTAHWSWKFINKQKAQTRESTNKLHKSAFPTVKWSVNNHINVQGTRTPFDGDIVYWSKRNSASYDGTTAKQLKRQQFKCASCQLAFVDTEAIELHHIDGNHNNWKPNNLEVLHRSCHQHQNIHASKR